MTYAMSDLHGCYGKYIKMLEKINFNDNDTLYILGDIVDRGPDGIKILQDIMQRKNVVALRGNHDFLAYYILKTISTPSDMYETDDFVIKYQSWIYDGGSTTEEAFMKLDDTEKKKILLYLNYMPIFEELTVGENKFHLSHTVPAKERMQNQNTLLWQEFIIGEPEYEKEYFSDKIIVTGHTPTGFIDTRYKGKIWSGNNHIAIDCGAVFGNPLGCICLDTLEEFYIEGISQEEEENE